MFNRRELLRYFAAGATIVPVLGGAPNMEAPAKLIEVPQVEPVELARPRIGDLAPPGIGVDGVLYGASPVFINVELHSAAGVLAFHAESFITARSQEWIDVTRVGDPVRQLLPGASFIERWTMKGYARNGFRPGRFCTRCSKLLADVR